MPLAAVGDLTQSAKNGPWHSIGERLLTSDEPPFGKAATDDSSNGPAHFQVLCAADQIR
jgi:hypothetical protein